MDSVSQPQTIPPQAQTPQPPIAEQGETNNNKPILIIIVILVLLTVGIFGIYSFIQQHKKLNSTLPSATTAPQPTQNISRTTITQKLPLSTVKADETSEWKTFESKDFSFKYPNDLYGIDISGYGIEFYMSEKNALQSKTCLENQSGTIDKPCELGMVFSINFKTYDITQYASFADFITKKQLDLFEPIESKKLIDQNNREWVASVAFEANGHYFTSAYFTLNDKVYGVSIAIPMGELAKYKFKQDYDHRLYADGSYYNAATEFTKQILFSVETK